MEQGIQTTSRSLAVSAKPFTLPCIAAFIKSKLPSAITFNHKILKPHVSDSDSSSSEEEDFTAGLPRNFADQVLELEMRIQNDFMDSQAIEELINLYSVRNVA